MGLALAAVMGWFRTNPRNLVFIAGLIGVIAVLAFVYARGRSDHAKKVEAAHAVEVAAAIASDTKADTKGAAVAQQQAERAADLKEELINAVAQIPDSVPDPVAVATGCLELCAQGERGLADLPACAPVRDQVRACPHH
jgi:hypothetical protein